MMVLNSIIGVRLGAPIGRAVLGLGGPLRSLWGGCGVQSLRAVAALGRSLLPLPADAGSLPAMA